MKEMSCPTSFQNFWSASENNIDIAAYRKICKDFHVSQVANWRQFSGGLGTAYSASSGIEVPGKDYDKSLLINIYPLDIESKLPNIGYEALHNTVSKLGDYTEATKMSFKKDQLAMILVSHIEQSIHVERAWVKFILDESQGFTSHVSERINDSIRTYVYAVLGAQAQANTGILTLGTGLDAKRECLNILEALIDSSVDLQDSIQRYKYYLQYARSQLNFVVGEGLYLLPSDMNLRIGTYAGYNNNNIFIVTSDTSLGSNRAMNSESQPDDQSLNNQFPSTDDQSLNNQLPSIDDQPPSIDDQSLNYQPSTNNL